MPKEVHILSVHRRASVYAEKGAAALVKGGVVSDPVTGDVLHDYDWTPMEAAEAVIDASGLVAEVKRLRGALERAEGAAMSEMAALHAHMMAAEDDAERLRSALREVITTQAIRHPLPWRIESDWTEEVVAADGYVIAKCMKREAAEAIIEEANRDR